MSVPMTHDGGGAAPLAATPGRRKPKIAISYRRIDSTVIVGRIGDRLAARYGRESIFVDVDSIPIGTDFRKYIQEVWSEIEVLIAVVGPKWLGERDGDVPRIHDRTDLVRIEVETALKKKILIIPVLIDGAKMPSEHLLPKSLQAFAARNAAHMDGGRDFHHHMDLLIQAIDPVTSARRESPNTDAAVADREPVQDPARPDRAAAAALGPARLAGEIALPVFVLLVLHHLIVNAFDLDTIYLRVVAWLVPFFFGAVLSWRARIGTALALTAAACIGVIAVAMMTVSESLYSGQSIVPATLFEWREAIEYVVSIAASFFAGCLSGRFLVLGRRKRSSDGPGPAISPG